MNNTETVTSTETPKKKTFLQRVYEDTVEKNMKIRGIAKTGDIDTNYQEDRVVADYANRTRAGKILSQTEGERLSDAWVSTVPKAERTARDLQVNAKLVALGGSKQVSTTPSQSDELWMGDRMTKPMYSRPANEIMQNYAGENGSKTKKSVWGKIREHFGEQTEEFENKIVTGDKKPGSPLYNTKVQRFKHKVLAEKLGVDRKAMEREGFTSEAEAIEAALGQDALGLLAVFF